MIVIGGGNAHPGLRLAIRTERTSSFDRDVLKLSVLLVLVERARRRIIGNVDIRPTVIVKIGSEHAEAVRAVCAKNSRRLPKRR